MCHSCLPIYILLVYQQTFFSSSPGTINVHCKHPFPCPFPPHPVLFQSWWGGSGGGRRETTTMQGRAAVHRHSLQNYISTQFTIPLHDSGFQSVPSASPAVHDSKKCLIMYDSCPSVLLCLGIVFHPPILFHPAQDCYQDLIPPKNYWDCRSLYPRRNLSSRPLGYVKGR